MLLKLIFFFLIEIDLIGTFIASQSVFKKSMKKNGGVIINITATLHWTGEPLQVRLGFL